jgi:glyoxylate/hydroxypyruvate reductase A
MLPIVPFVHTMDQADARIWLAALRVAAPGVDVRFAGDIAASDRASVKVAIVANPDPADLAGFPNLLWVQSLWAGVEHILRELPEGPVQIVRLIDPQLADTMAEAALAWTLYLHRNMPTYAAQQKRKLWKQHDVPSASACRVAVLGLGQLGQASAARLVANGFTVTGWSRSEKTIAGITTFHGAQGLLQVVAEADIVLILLPSTRQTRGLIDPGVIGAMKAGSSLINFARGDIIDTDALRAGLRSGHLDHAVLDVFTVEPLPDSDPLWEDEKVTILPHISAPTNKSTASAIAARNVVTFLETEKMPVTVSRDTGY